jgi:hypothetical protein
MFRYKQILNVPYLGHGNGDLAGSTPLSIGACLNHLSWHACLRLATLALPAMYSLLLGKFFGFFLRSLGSCFYEILEAHHFDEGLRSGRTPHCATPRPRFRLGTSLPIRDVTASEIGRRLASSLSQRSRKLSLEALLLCLQPRYATSANSH